RSTPPRRGRKRANDLDQAAQARGVRPGIEAPCGMGPLGNPHLLERRPPIGRALRAQQVRAVGLLEAEVHLQAAVVGGVWLVPGPLVAMDAEPLTLVRRAASADPDRGRAVLPDAEDPLAVCGARSAEVRSRGRRAAGAEDRLPVPRRFP